MTQARLKRRIGLAALGLLTAGAALSLAQAASAQTMGANSASFNAGYGRTAGQENRPVDVTLGDANGNVTVVNGLIQAGASSSVFAHASAGAMDSVSGVGGSASAIGNNLTVVVQGNNNITVVTATQTNTGTVTATNTTNGKH
jgi:holdfast attachment protein HfaA